MKKTPCVIVALMFLMTGLALSEEPVHFPDANLRQAVEDNLLVNDPTPSHMLLLVWLDGYEYNITDLTGLEYATNLVSLDLAYNNISDISALSGLNGLFELYLEDNEIVDISALSGLTNLEVLYLNNNSIRDISALSEQRMLFDLDLGHNQISDISALSKLTQLGELILNDNLISDISGISDLNWLYFLDLSSNPLNDDAYNIHIPRIIENNPGIEIYYDSQTAARLIVSSANGGSVTRPGEGTFDYNYGDIVVIEATADHGYIFANWAGSAVDNGKVTNPDAASTTVTVDGNYTLRATFLRPDGVVYFPDPNLQACVEHALGIPNPTPTDMLLLTHLNSRDMPGKIFTDLTGLEYATNLVELDLYGNRISELSALSELTDLTMLDLGSNEIDDITPLAGLTKLTDLFLDDNQIWDISPLSGLTNLKGLDLSFNWIDSLSSLSNLKNLVWLGLEESEVYNISPLSQLDGLVELYLGWNYIEDLSALSGLRSLSVLDLGCNAEDELDLFPLAGLTNLTYLDLEQNYIEGISPLSGLTNLGYLNLNLTEAWDISPLSGLHNLEWLELESNYVDDLSPLAGLAMLKHLDLSMNFFISDISALSQVPSLEWVDLSQNDVNDISALLNLSHLERVILWGNPLTDETCLHVQELINRGVVVLCNCGVQVHTLTISSTSGGRVTEPGHGLFTQIVHGTTKAIEATADPGYYFVNWTGTAVDAGKVDDPYSAITMVTVDENYTLTANFALEEGNGNQESCTIEFDFVPPFESNDDLSGLVLCDNPDDCSNYAVAVYICTPPYGWWSKPYWDSPLSPIAADCSWTCDITTDVQDLFATKIVAFLVPDGYVPPLANGKEECLPSELYDYPYTEAIRYKKISFAGYDWWVKRHHDPVGPGPNYFSDSNENVYIDSNGYLHMGITKRDGQWYCSEVIADTNLGYGTYVFTVKGRVDLFDENVALGLFTWEDCASKCNFREIDIEISKWSNPEIVNAQFVVQPHTNPLNIIRFNIDCSEYDVTTHEFTWKPDSVDFQSYYGDYPLMDPKFLIEDGNWSYTGDDIPTEGMEKPHINFWLASGLPPTDDQDTEITIKNFRYLPIFGNYNNDNNVDFADFATYQAN